MQTLERLGPADLAAAMDAFGAALATHRETINKLNVYPVPDGDTGSNMHGTVTAVVEGLPEDRRDMGTVCKAISHSSLMGAKGNSGVILSQLLRGMTEILREHDAIDGTCFAAALTRASVLSYEAVGNPKEGTILTVVRESAEAATSAALEGLSLVEVVHAAVVEGRASLDRTPDLLPVLAKAGVVDSGAAGFLLLLDGVLHVIDGRPIPDPPDAPDDVAARLGYADEPSDNGRSETAGAGERAGDKRIEDLRYEVMYLLEAPDESIAGFKEVWAGIGDSIVVVGGDGLFNCHIHTDDIGPAVEAAIEIGRPRDIRVTDLLDELHEVEEAKWVREAGIEPEPEPEPVPCGVVAVSTGDGIARIFRNLRVQRVVTGGQTMNPSTKELLEAVEAVPAPQVVLLPNNKNIVAVADQVDALTDKTVRVLPTRSVTEGFSALLAYDPEADAATNVEAMSEVAAAVRHGEVTKAVRASDSDAGPIAVGDWIGIDGDGIRVVARDLDSATTGLLGVMLDDAEIVTVIEGEGASAGHTRHITEWLAEHHPDVEPEVHHGGQPLYPYLFGVE